MVARLFQVSSIFIITVENSDPWSLLCADTSKTIGQ